MAHGVAHGVAPHDSSAGVAVVSGTKTSTADPSGGLDPNP